MTRLSLRIRLLLVVLPSLVLVLGAGGSGASAETNGPIAATALKYVGTHGGQCWTFMQQVVFEATGRHVGGDYRQGYFDAGAVEVSADEATNGDIIQIADDSNTSPWASYPGLHTAIVLTNLGGHRFDAVDSNQNWDEMVNLRPGYDPYAAAARYGLQVHIYRVSGNAAAAVPTLAVGDGATVSADPGCLNLRGQAGLGGAILDCLPSGTTVSVVDGPASADGFVWVKVETARGSGWVAARYLVRTPAVAPVPTSVSAPDSPSAGAAAAPAILAHVDNSPGCLNLRDGAGLSGRVVACLAPGTPLTLLDAGAAVAADGYSWAHVRGDDGAEGWVASSFLIIL
ncbi:MAG: SH3 domain-containing protein [Dehalococcoidia bacterium]|nr:SH3 domain-containing protein [Dehalococcoidia bacterium]